MIIAHIHPMSESELGYGEFWTGLVNSNKEICYHGDCVNKLKWDSDKSYLDSWADTSHGVHVNGGDDCLRYTNKQMDDWGCSGKNGGYYYICEFKCQGTRV